MTRTKLNLLALACAALLTFSGNVYAQQPSGGFTFGTAPSPKSDKADQEKDKTGEEEVEVIAETVEKNGDSWRYSKVKPAKPNVSTTQTKESDKSKQELPSVQQLLVQGIESNPDILVAKAKLQEAEAELNRTRLRIAREIVAARITVDNGRKTMARIKELPAGSIASKEIRDKMAALATAEAELQYLLGVLPAEAGSVTMNGPINSNAGIVGSVTIDGPQPPERIVYESMEVEGPRGRGMVGWARKVSAAGTAAQAPRGKNREELLKKLNQPVNFDFVETPLDDVLSYLHDQQKVRFVIDQQAFDAAGIKYELPIVLWIKDVPLAAALEAFEDLFEPLCFVVRDYGIVVTTRNSTVAKKGISAVELWRGAQEAKEAADSPRPSPGPAPYVPGPAPTYQRPQLPPTEAPLEPIPAASVGPEQPVEK